MKTRYCENDFCENVALKQVPVSVNRAGDEQRWFCPACEQAYTIGCQHGKMELTKHLLQTEAEMLGMTAAKRKRGKRK